MTDDPQIGDREGSRGGNRTPNDAVNSRGLFLLATLECEKKRGPLDCSSGPHGRLGEEHALAACSLARPSTLKPQRPLLMSFSPYRNRGCEPALLPSRLSEISPTPRKGSAWLRRKDSNLHGLGQSQPTRLGTPQCSELSGNRTQPRGLRDRCSALELTAHAFVNLEGIGPPTSDLKGRGSATELQVLLLSFWCVLFHLVLLFPWSRRMESNHLACGNAFTERRAFRSTPHRGFYNPKTTKAALVSLGGLHFPVGYGFRLGFGLRLRKHGAIAKRGQAILNALILSTEDRPHRQPFGLLVRRGLMDRRFHGSVGRAVALVPISYTRFDEPAKKKLAGYVDFPGVASPRREARGSDKRSGPSIGIGLCQKQARHRRGRGSHVEPSRLQVDEEEEHPLRRVLGGSENHLDLVAKSA